MNCRLRIVGNLFPINILYAALDVAIETFVAEPLST